MLAVLFSLAPVGVALRASCPTTRVFCRIVSLMRGGWSLSFHLEELSMWAWAIPKIDHYAHQGWLPRFRDISILDQALNSSPSLLSVGHEEAPRTKPGCVTQRFLLSASWLPRGELAFVTRSLAVALPWLHAIRNNLHPL